MQASEIRRRFLSFFADRGHTVVPSSPLVPQNDPTLFFVNAGMVQFKDVFTGVERREYKRATTVQKCLRVSGKHNDLEVVGRTPRHHTFFEMLGNFSFGDYFKAEAIPMAWELLTGDLGLDPARLWITVFREDDEAFDLWRSAVGVPAERIQRLDEKDNFWSMGPVGPCGPCSEIHYDHGPAIDPRGGGPATGSDRYVEIWNLVFMQYEQTAAGPRLDLPRPSIDTGSGLERVVAASQGVFSNYDTDAFQPLIARAAREAGARYGEAEDRDVALRVIADHARATAFLVAEGVMPGNKDQGYVLRRLMRRAIRFGVKLQIDRPFMHLVTAEVIDRFGDVYPELADRRTFVDEVVRAEEERFRSTLDRGMKLLDAELDRAGRGGVLPGGVAFTLADTYGFPLDLTELIASERGVRVDADAFQSELAAQKARGREAWRGSGEVAVQPLWPELAQRHGTTSFTGYDRVEDVGAVLALVRREQEGEEVRWAVVDALDEGQEGVVVLDRTPFYAESGGQLGDTGELVGGAGAARVDDTTKAAGLHLHRVTVTRGSLAAGETLRLAVDDAARRAHVRRNHTATHLLHAALRAVLGDHVAQKGSLVGPDRLRFDFSHHRALSAEELLRVEDLVNAHVLANHPVQTALMDLEEARATGAMALFGEKYDELVRVVSVPGFSRELCGGTHASRTGDIGSFRVLSEGAVAAGVRRVEAVTGEGALAWARDRARRLDEAADQLKTSPEGLLAAIRKLLDDRRRVERELADLRAELARAAATDLVSLAREVGGVKVLAAEFDGDLKEQADRLRDQLGTSLVVLFGRKGAEVQLVAAATKDIAGRRVNAGDVVKAVAPLVGGRGGGRPDMAQAGGKDPAGIPAASEAVHALAADKLG